MSRIKWGFFRCVLQPVREIEGHPTVGIKQYGVVFKECGCPVPADMPIVSLVVSVPARRVGRHLYLIGSKGAGPDLNMA